jgi:hypothetical protein
MRWLAVVLVIACSHPAPPPPPPKPVSNCARVGDHLVGLMSAAQNAKQDQLDPIRNMITSHCENDGWSADAQQCWLTIDKLEDGGRCEKLFTDAQEAAMNGDNRSLDKQTGESPDKK